MPVTDPSTPVPDAPGARLAEAPEGLQDHRTARPGSHRPERDPWMGTWWTWVPTCLDVETNRPEGWMDGWKGEKYGAKMPSAEDRLEQFLRGNGNN